jgi:2-methylcitrate dehydratase PrpD
MGNETARLAEYAAALRYDDIPADVVERAKHCITDTVAAIVFGHHLPWSRMIVAFAEKNGAGGKSRILGPGGARVHAGAAALANGALAHAFEMDNLTWPNTGVHPGATLLSSALAVAQERDIGGRELVTAVVAGSEVMIRIGRATRHNNEARGFHAPGTTGPFGAAVACGRLMGFDAGRMRNALGIAGSLACGLLEFARSGTGAMVKRLHLGRAAESGVLAASLAADGFTGPASVLEGEFGYLQVFCGGDYDAGELTRELGESYATLSIMLKRFPCHITAHTSVQAIQELREAHGYSGTDVSSITIAGNDKMARINNIPAPADVMMAQYSIPFCVALAHFRDPRDPRAFDETALRDPQIRALTERITITVAKERPTPLAAEVIVSLRDGRRLRRQVVDFKGTPGRPLDRNELRDKFLLSTRHCGGEDMALMFDRLQNLENEASLDWIGVRAQ